MNDAALLRERPKRGKTWQADAAVLSPTTPAARRSMTPLDEQSGGNYMLRRIDHKLDALSDKLETKADRQAVHKLESTVAAHALALGNRIDELSTRVHELEQHEYAAKILEAQASTRFTRREKTIGAVVAIIAAIGTLTNIAVALYVYA